MIKKWILMLSLLAVLFLIGCAGGKTVAGEAFFTIKTACLDMDQNSIPHAFLNNSYVKFRYSNFTMRNFSDYCQSSLDLVEYTCAVNSSVQSVVFNCPKWGEEGYTCSGGKCLKTGISFPCTDTDSGIDYKVAGTVADENGQSHVDVCTADGKLTENLCSNGKWEPKTITCDLEITGTSCVSGACVILGTACGNGLLENTGEQCDDGNSLSGDGCSATCTVESGYTCPTINGYRVGGPCVKNNSTSY